MSSVDFGAAPVIADFSARIMRGDRVGIIGPNGAGKTTLDQAPDRRARARPPGRSTAARRWRLRTSISSASNSIRPPPSWTTSRAAAATPSRSAAAPRHVSSYLRDFLFPPERLQAPVSMLSGGERNRLLLARLFARPSNLLVMDEPTNDLDAETLDLLEELVADYAGTLLLVSHDRAFLDNVVTSTLVFEGGGRLGEYVGGYSDWLRQRRPAPQVEASAPSAPPASKPQAGALEAAQALLQGSARARRAAREHPAARGRAGIGAGGARRSRVLQAKPGCGACGPRARAGPRPGDRERLRALGRARVGAAVTDAQRRGRPRPIKSEGPGRAPPAESGMTSEEACSRRSS